MDYPDRLRSLRKNRLVESRGFADLPGPSRPAWAPRGSHVAAVAASRRSAANLLVCAMNEKVCGALTRRRYGPRSGPHLHRGVDFASHTDLNANKPSGRTTFQWHESICSVQ